MGLRRHRIDEHEAHAQVLRQHRPERQRRFRHGVRRIGRDDAARFAVLLDLGKKLVFDLEILDHGLDHEVTIFDLREVICEIA